MNAVPPAVAAWQAIAASRSADRLPSLLAEDVVLRSPAIHAPQEGRDRVLPYLAAALVVLGPTLHYRREWYAEDSAVLEFDAVVDGLDVHGVDIVRWNADDRLAEFTVLIRPFRALQHLITRMSRELTG